MVGFSSSSLSFTRLILVLLLLCSSLIANAHVSELVGFQPEPVVSGLKGQPAGFDVVVWLRSKSDPCSQVKNICEKSFVLAGLEKNAPDRGALCS